MLYFAAHFNLGSNSVWRVHFLAATWTLLARAPGRKTSFATERARAWDLGQAHLVPGSIGGVGLVAVPSFGRHLLVLAPDTAWYPVALSLENILHPPLLPGGSAGCVFRSA